MILAKRLTEKQKEKILKNFLEGKNIDQISKELNFTKSTISRNLKKNLGESQFKILMKKNKLIEKKVFTMDNKENVELNQDISDQPKNNDTNLGEYSLDIGEFSSNQFVEISPLECEIENATRKDLSSIPISEMEFPKIVYMVVDKKIELETKFLKEFAEWQFLPSHDLERKTIEIFDDLKFAKRKCSKEQKVIKVPNTNVFNIVAPILISRGITRIIIAEKLISL